MVTNCRLTLCISDNVRTRGGSEIESLRSLIGTIAKPPVGWELEAETMAETIDEVVCSRTCSASDGAFAT